MKNQIISNSIGFICLGLGLISSPTWALANVSGTSSLLPLNHKQFNTAETVEVAQRYLSSQNVSGQLKNSESRILNTASQYSQGKPVRWDYISVEETNAQEIKLNICGKIMKPGKPHLRIGFKLQRNNQGGFTIVDHDWSLNGKMSALYRSAVSNSLRNLPSHYPNFQQELNNILG